MATQLLGVMSEHAGHELKHLNDANEQLDRYTRMWRQNLEREANNLRIESLRKFIVNECHGNAIVHWLVFRSRMLADEPEWEWSLGQPVPGLSSPPAYFQSDALELSIPDEYMCSITYVLMSEPVSTADNHNYDRQAIQQWFAINNTSPKTGLALPYTNVIIQRRLARDINAWVDGAGFSRSGRNSSSITFSSRLGTFTRQLRTDVTCTDIYHVVFQALRGRHPSFQLRVQGRIGAFAPSDAFANTHGVVGGSTITIALPDDSQASSTTTAASSGGQVLIKVYGPNKHFAFSYWVPKTTKVAMASVLFKYWRKNVLTWGLAGDLKALVTWTNMSDDGDGHSTGYVRKTYEKLNAYFGPAHATGCLQEETVFSQPRAGSQGNVLKVYVALRPSDRRKLQTSRMDVLKQCFDSLVNRTIAYNYNTHIGLIKFSSTANVARPLTDVVEDFRATVNQLQPKNDTAIWDGLKLGMNQIIDYAAKFPQAKKRILCITDGEDTKSTADVVNVAEELVKNDICVDSFCLGSEDHDKLLAVSHITGGYKFVPKSLSQAMAICELEPVLSLTDREDIVLPSSRRGTALSRFNRALHDARPETVTKDVYPKRRAHPNMADDVIELAAAKRMASGSRAGGNMLRNARLLTEIQGVIANPHPSYDVYISERDISFWKIVLQGPGGSPYASGTFMLYLNLTESWPTFAPRARFVTPIHHPNVNANGRICHSLFDRNWTSDTSCVNILNSIYGLLLSPDYSDPV